MSRHAARTQTHTRAHPRAEVDWVAALRCQGSMAAGRIRDLSAGGAFFQPFVGGEASQLAEAHGGSVESAAPLTALLSLILPSGQAFEVEVEVRWVGRHDGHSCTGVGLRMVLDTPHLDALLAAGLTELSKRPVARNDSDDLRELRLTSMQMVHEVRNAAHLILASLDELQERLGDRGDDELEAIVNSVRLGAQHACHVVRGLHASARGPQNDDDLH